MKAGVWALALEQRLGSSCRQYLMLAVNKRRVNGSETSVCRVEEVLCKHLAGWERRRLGLALQSSSSLSCKQRRWQLHQVALGQGGGIGLAQIFRSHV